MFKSSQQIGSVVHVLLLSQEQIIKKSRPRLLTAVLAFSEFRSLGTAGRIQHTVEDQMGMHAALYNIQPALVCNSWRLQAADSAEYVAGATFI